MVTSAEYPIHLGLAYLFLGGYVASRFFKALDLPASVGIIVNGFIFSHFIQSDLLSGRDHLQSLAFFLVLLTAGFEISVKELKLSTFAFALIPVSLELMGITAWAVCAMDYSVIEGLVLGTTLCCLGDGLVIPKMEEFRHREEFKDLRLPRLVYTWAPLEASYVLTVFGIIQGMADAANQESASWSKLVLANIWKLVATLLCGSFLGHLAARFIAKDRDELMVPNLKKWLLKSVPSLQGSCGVKDVEDLEDEKGLFFNGCKHPLASVEAYLVIVCVALFGFGLGAEEGRVMVPMGFSPGSMFQPELMVIVIGATFATYAEEYDAKKQGKSRRVPKDEENIGLVFSALPLPPNRVTVEEVQMKSWADEQGIRRGDMILSLNGKEVENMNEEEFKAVQKERPLDIRYLVMREEEDAECDEADEPADETLDGVMRIVAGVWIFGQLVLFSMLGSKTDISVFAQIFQVLPIMVVGKLFRFGGVCAVTRSTFKFRTCDANPACSCAQDNEATVKWDALFCFLSTLPRATIQGALGPIPARERFFHSDHFRLERTQFIAAAARLYVVCMAIGGSILLDYFGTRALHEVKKCTKCPCLAEQVQKEDRARQSIASQRRSTFFLEEAPQDNEVRPEVRKKRQTVVPTAPVESEEEEEVDDGPSDARSVQAAETVLQVEPEAPPLATLQHPEEHKVRANTEDSAGTPSRSGKVAKTVTFGEEERKKLLILAGNAESRPSGSRPITTERRSSLVSNRSSAPKQPRMSLWMMEGTKKAPQKREVKKSAEGSDEELHDGGVEVRLEDLRPELRDRGLLPVAGQRPNDYQPLASDDR